MLSVAVHTSPSLLKQRVGNSRTYIRPIQKDLDFVKDTIDAVCVYCSLVNIHNFHNNTSMHSPWRNVYLADRCIPLTRYKSMHWNARKPCKNVLRIKIDGTVVVKKLKENRIRRTMVKRRTNQKRKFKGQEKSRRRP